MCDSPGCKEPNRQTLCQVWFTGMHTDIGGGYARRGFSDIALAWMLRKAHQHGLLIYADHKEHIFEDYGEDMNDSRATLTAKILYRPATRNLDGFGPGEPVVHETVGLRKKTPEINYDPWIFRKACVEEKWVPYDHHELLAAQETKWKEWRA